MGLCRQSVLIKCVNGDISLAQLFFYKNEKFGKKMEKK